MVGEYIVYNLLVELQTKLSTAEKFNDDINKITRKEIEGIKSEIEVLKSAVNALERRIEKKNV